MANLYSLLGDLLRYHKCPSAAPRHLVEEIIKNLDPRAGYHIPNENGRYNGFVAAGGQGLLFYVFNKDNIEMALKVAVTGPVTLNRRVYSENAAVAKVELIRSVPDVRFRENAELQKKIWFAIDKYRDEYGLTFTIPQVYDVSQTSDANQIPFFTMEWMQGGDITAVTKDRKDICYSLQLYLELLKAVDFVHILGIVHRDLKARNIKVGENNSIILLDFGLARPINERRNVTESGERVPLGTLPYASPKMVDGFAEQATPPDDVHGLGYVLWELIWGKECPDYLGDPKDFEYRDKYRIERAGDLAIPLQKVFLKATNPIESERYRSVQELREQLQLAYNRIATQDRFPRCNWEQTIIEPVQRKIELPQVARPLTPPKPQAPKPQQERKVEPEKAPERNFKKAMTRKFLQEAQFPPVSFPESDSKTTEKLSPGQEAAVEAEYFKQIFEDQESEIKKAPCGQFCKFQACKKNGLGICKELMLSNLRIFKRIFLEERD